MRTLYQDIRFGIRMLVKNPGFALTVVLCLGLGIGACTAILSVVNAVLLRPLPYEDSKRLVAIGERDPDGGHSANSRMAVSPRLFLDLREQTQSFEEIAFSKYGRFYLTGGESPEMVHASRVSANSFKVLGAKPLLGRTFLPGEDQPGNSDVAVISHGLWQRRFGGDPNLVGRTISFIDLVPHILLWSSGEDRVCTVIGIMPPRFLPCRAIGRPEMWVPQVFEPDELNDRRHRRLLAFGRLKAGVSRKQAQAEADLLVRRLAEEHPQSNGGWAIQLQPLRETFVGGGKQSLLMLAGAVGFVLLIACANVANMLLARAAARQKEVAVRATLGAGRWRLIRQLLTESVLLAALGAGVGLLLTHWSIGLLRPLIPGSHPQAWEIGIDARMFGFTLLILFATGLVCGLIPAWQLSKTDLTEAIKEGGGGSMGGPGRKFSRSFLVVFQVSLALVLLIGAGLMIQTLVRLLRVDPGFKPHNLMQFSITLPKKYPPPQRITLFEQLLERIGSLPGVTSAASISGWYTNCACSIGRYDYFRTMGIPLLHGRYFTEDDFFAEGNNVIVNERAAHKFWPGENPIGKRIDKHPMYGRWLSLTVVGVVKNIRRMSYVDEAGPQFYIPYRRLEKMKLELLMTDTLTPHFVVRSTTDPLSLARNIHREVAALGNHLPVTSSWNWEDILFKSTAKQRLYMRLLTLFAIIGLILAAIGIYGVISYSIARRTHEIGIRMALGARRSDVFKLVIKKGLILIVIGMVIGVVGALALTRVLRSLLYDVAPTDPVTFVTVSLLLTAVGLMACYIPARRAAKIDPMVALRYE
ncbi:MAG: ABC transporter permease [Phycisphaerales bacterium]|nr:MAG: ABC transporter permease [Phycisphaerales bacterium]